MKSEPSQAETIAALALRCDGTNQFDAFDRGVRASLSVSKEAVLKAEAKEKRARGAESCQEDSRVIRGTMPKVYAQHAFAGKYHLEIRYAAPEWEWFVLDAKRTGKTLFSDKSATLDNAKQSACARVGLSFAEWMNIGPEIEIA